MSELTRDPLQPWPIIDGPMQGHTWAHPADYFYAAELTTPGLTPSRQRTARPDDAGRIEYRLYPAQAGGYEWRCTAP